MDGVHHLLGLMSAPTGWGPCSYGRRGCRSQTVATFIPVVAASIFLAVLESSGCLARAAFVVDALDASPRPARQGVRPHADGLGCTVPAVMATRTLGSERRRMTWPWPLHVCGAACRSTPCSRWPSSPSQQNLVFGLYLFGILVAVLTGLFPAQHLLPGRSDSMVMEMPDYIIGPVRWTMGLRPGRSSGLHLRRGQDHRLMVAVLSVLNSLGTDGSFGNQDQEDSGAEQASQSVTPVLHPIGVRDDNWQATVGILTGIFAKGEAVVATSTALYAGGAGDESRANYPCSAA